MKIAVLIPCYNECATIGKVIRDYEEALPEADIYVYDNNSSDDTAEVAQKAGAVVRHECRQGKGNVIRTMFHEIDADCYLITDGDDTYPARHAKEMVELVLKKGADMVIGDRLSSTYFSENKRRFHQSGNVLVRGLVNRLFHGNITDIMTGYRAFSPLFVKSFPVLAKGFEIETEMTIHALDKNLNVLTIPVDYRDRPQGSESKLDTYTDGMKVLATIFTLFKDYRPLSFFSTISLLLLAAATGLIIPVLIEFLHTGLVPRIPTLVGAGFIGLTAILLFCCGLILDTESKKSRQNFEIQMNMLLMLHKMQCFSPSAVSANERENDRDLRSENI